MLARPHRITPTLASFNIPTTTSVPTTIDYELLKITRLELVCVYRVPNNIVKRDVSWSVKLACIELCPHWALVPVVLSSMKYVFIPIDRTKI